MLNKDRKPYIVKVDSIEKMAGRIKDRDYGITTALKFENLLVANDSRNEHNVFQEFAIIDTRKDRQIESLTINNLSKKRLVE